MAARALLQLLPPLLLLLLLLQAPARAAGGGPLLASKCCPPAQQLDARLLRCVPHPAAPPVEPGLASETAAAALLRAGAGGVPWWLNGSAALLDPATLARGARVRYGRRPCAPAATLHVFTARADEFRLLANGSLLLRNVRSAQAGAGAGADAPAQVALPPEEWCSDREESGRVVLLTCPCSRVTCVPWCCNRQQVYDLQQAPGPLRCQQQAAPAHWAPAFHDGRSPAAAPAVLYAARYGRPPACDALAFDKKLLNPTPGSGLNAFWLQRDGSVLLERCEGQPERLPPEHFCVARVAAGGAPATTALYFCDKREAPAAENIYYSVLFLSGAFFLLLTLLVHAAVPELRRSAHAKALMCHCASLLVASVTLTVGHLRRRYSPFFCAASAFVVQYFFLGTFFWLNVMCFDLTRTFVFVGWTQPNLRGGDRRFLCYSLYAWGCPALICSVTAFLQYASVASDLPHLPNIAKCICWFGSRAAELLYYYAPMALLLVADVVLFALAALRIKGEHRSTGALRAGHDSRVTRGCALVALRAGAAAEAAAAAAAAAEAETPADPGRAPHDRRMLHVFAKLFCVMGVTWLLEVGAWLGHAGEVPFWYVTDAVNFLRGVLIFVLFCCKPAAVRPLRERVRSCAARCCPWALRWLRAGAEGGAGGGSSTQSSGLSAARPTSAPPTSAPRGQQAERRTLGGRRSSLSRT